ncbi:hypothetical protein [Natrinema soli]|uniref:Uncharacterized protein n=1 Tax=Natrinema soli TaxID=1930624 RepID=A0ABD5SRC2_9EURY|nr:hypothetical protein [Natrinema soli]
MASAESNTAVQTGPVRSRGYCITVDDGRESFFALSIERVDSEDAWLMSDTAVALENVR